MRVLIVHIGMVTDMCVDMCTHAYMTCVRVGTDPWLQRRCPLNLADALVTP